MCADSQFWQQKTEESSDWVYHGDKVAKGTMQNTLPALVYGWGSRGSGYITCLRLRSYAMEGSLGGIEESFQSLFLWISLNSEKAENEILCFLPSFIIRLCLRPLLTSRTIWGGSWTRRHLLNMSRVDGFPLPWTHLQDFLQIQCVPWKKMYCHSDKNSHARSGDFSLPFTISKLWKY